jgi:type III secretory pathway lipoprotein EscJ
VKTLESKETRASKEITVTHNSVFAAHRLQCRMTTRKIDIRHFVLESIEATALCRCVQATSTERSDDSFRSPSTERRDLWRLLSKIF